MPPVVPASSPVTPFRQPILGNKAKKACNLLKQHSGHRLVYRESAGPCWFLLALLACKSARRHTRGGHVISYNKTAGNKQGLVRSTQKNTTKEKKSTKKKKLNKLTQANDNGLLSGPARSKRMIPTLLLPALPPLSHSFPLEGV